MTGREKIQAALSATGSYETPAVICYEGIYIRDHWDDLTNHPWWLGLSPDIDDQLAWRRDVMAAIGQDWFNLPQFEPRVKREHSHVQERGDGVYLVDRASGRETLLERPAVSGQKIYSREFATGYADKPCMPVAQDALDKAIAAPESAALENMKTDGSTDLAAALLAGDGSDLYPIVHVISPLWACFARWQFEDVMVKCLTHPQAVAYACERNLAQARHAVRCAAQLGARGIWIEECMTDMVGPGVFAELNVPVMTDLVEEIRRCGMNSIYYYCGDPAGKWEHLLACGADALSLEEGKKTFVIDIEDVAQRVAGRCALLGNLDALTVLSYASDADLCKEIDRQISVGRRHGGRFVMSTGSPVTPETAVERVRRYCEIVHEACVR